MGSTFHSLHYHVVFSTKERRPFIDGKWRKDLHAYLGGIIRGLDGVKPGSGRPNGSESYYCTSLPT